MIKILVDTAGGDKSPDVNIEGGVLALQIYLPLKYLLLEYAFLLIHYRFLLLLLIDSLPDCNTQVLLHH